MRQMLKSKIHMAHVTESNIKHEESLTIDKTLMREADILSYEVVEVFNINSGARIQTYAIEGKPDSGIICANGAAARLIHPTDKVIILTYYNVSEEEALNTFPIIVFVDENNVITGSRSSNNNGLG